MENEAVTGLRTAGRLRTGAVFGCLCVVILGYAWVSAANPRYSDELDYWEIAGNIASGNGYTLRGVDTAFRPPTWPLLLVPAQLFGAGLFAGSLLSVAALIGAAWVAGKLGSDVVGGSSGRLAGLFVLAYPINIYTAATLYPQMLALLLTTLMWWLVARSELESATPLGRMSVLGLSAGLLSLAVPTLAFTAVALLLAASWRPLRSRNWPPLLAAWATAGATIGAWVARNWMTFGEFIPISTSTGINLLLGNNPNATADSGVNADISATLERVYSQGLSENGRSQEMVREAVRWITENPGEATMLYFQKALHYFVAYDAPATAGRGSQLLGLIAWAVWLVLIALVVVRWSPWGRRRLPALVAEHVMLWIFLANAFVMAVFFTRVRFRTPLDIFMLVEAALGLLILARRRRGPVLNDVESGSGGPAMGRT